MKNTAIIILAVLLAASIVFGFVIYNKNSAELLSKDAAVSDLQGQLDQARVRFKSLEQEKQEAQDAIGRLRDSIFNLEEAQTQAAERTKELESTHALAVSSLKNDLDNRDASISRIREDLHQAEKENTRLNELIGKHQQEIEGFQEQLISLTKEKTDIEIESNDTTARLAKTLAGLERDLKQRDGLINDLEERLNNAGTAIASRDQDIEKLQQTIVDLKRATEASGSMVEDLKSRHAAVLSGLSNDLKEKDARIRALETELKSSNAKISDLQAKLESAQTKVTSLEDQSAQNQERADSFRGRLAEIQEEKQALAHDLEAFKSTQGPIVAGLHKELETRNSAISNFQADLRQASAENGRLREELQTCSLERDTLRDTAASLKKEKTAAELEMNALRNSRDKTLATLWTGFKERDDLIARLHEELKESKERMSSLRDKVIKDQQEIEKLCLRVSEILGKETRLKADMDQMKSTYDSMVFDLKKQIQNKEVTIDQLEEKLSITFVDRILFEFGRTTITQPGKDILKKVGDILRTADNKKIRVIGHTDDKPISEEYHYKYPSNWELSSQRAASVVRFFQDEIGLDPRNLEVVGRSFHDPIASNETDEGRALNRRVTIAIAPKVD